MHQKYANCITYFNVLFDAYLYVATYFKKYKVLNYFFIFHFAQIFHNLSLSYYKALQET